MQPLFFGMSTWRMEAHVARHPGQALPLTAAQVAVVAATSALWSIVSGGERKMIRGGRRGRGGEGGGVRTISTTASSTTVTKLITTVTATTTSWGGGKGRGAEGREGGGGRERVCRGRAGEGVGRQG